MQQTFQVCCFVPVIEFDLFVGTVNLKSLQLQGEYVGKGLEPQTLSLYRIIKADDCKTIHYDESACAHQHSQCHC